MSSVTARGPAPANPEAGISAVVAWVLASVGILLRCLALVVFLRLAPQADLLAQCGAGIGLHLTALAMLISGRINASIVLSGVDYGLLASLTPRIGTASELHLYALLHPFLALIFTRWSLRIRVLLGLLPPLLFAVIRLSTDVPLSSGVLPAERLRDLATLNVLVFVGLCLIVTVASLRIREEISVRARRLAEARSQLIDDMSHELRTPVAILLTSAQTVLERERTNRAYQRALRVVEQQSRSLGRIIEQMLEMSRVERADLVLDLSDDLVASVQEIADSYVALADARSVEIVIEAEPVDLLTDAAVLRLALGNLLVNAIRFSPEGGRVEVRVVDDQGRPCVRVRDHGPGIPAEDLPHVFTRYWRGDRARSRRDGHVGLGLSIARRSARLLGADIGVESRPGAGATFTVRW